MCLTLRLNMDADCFTSLLRRRTTALTPATVSTKFVIPMIPKFHSQGSASGSGSAHKIGIILFPFFVFVLKEVATCKQSLFLSPNGGPIPAGSTGNQALHRSGTLYKPVCDRANRFQTGDSAVLPVLYFGTDTTSFSSFGTENTVRWLAMDVVRG